MRRGVSAVEVLLALIVLVVLLLPVMGLSQSQERESYFLEFELMGQRRCRGMIDYALTQSLPALEAAATSRFQPGLDGMSEAPLTVPAGLEGLGRIERLPAGAVETPTPAGGRLALYTDELVLGRARVGPDGMTRLYRIRSRVTWRFPGDAPSVAPHSFDMVRLVARPGLSHALLVKITP